MAKSYYELLKHPKWQEKRLRILERDNFSCPCTPPNEQVKQLQVHHLFYEKGKKPWEYDDKYLITLCEDCHEYIEQIRKEFLKDLAEYGIDIWWHIGNSHCAKMINKDMIKDQEIVRKYLNERHE